ncbi:MAG: phosphoribosylglycinamide formyltransferase [Bacillota bacterium]
MHIGVLASGRGSNLQAIIDAIEEGRLHVTLRVVISDREDAPALDRARQAGVPAVFLNPKDFPGRIDYDLKVAEVLSENGVDLVVLAGYMRLISAEFLARYPQRVINIHPSLLPAFPGLNAQEQALAYGVKFSGCTVHFVDVGMDTGPVIAQAVVPVLDNDTEETLSERILREEHRLYPQVLEWIAAGRVIVSGRRVIVK